MAFSRLLGGFATTTTLALFALLYGGGCRGSGVLASGGWLFQGDDVIVTRAKGATTSTQALSRVLRTLKRSGLEADTVHREVGYVRTRPERVDDTLAVRLNIVATDSSSVEIAGEVADPRAAELEWYRVRWNEGLPRGSGPWTIMTDLARAVGTIQDYEEDPSRYGSVACGGRHCAEDEICRQKVCMAESRGSIGTAGNAGCPSDREQALIAEIHSYRRSRGLSRIPVSPALNKVAQIHVRDLAQHAPHDENGCNLHSWSEDGEWTPCCYTPDHAQASCMWRKPQEITSYAANGYEIAASGATTAKDALSQWQSSPGHNAVLVNRGTWSSVKWEAMGVGMFEKYAVVWFGERPDSTATSPSCEEN